jgi:hypothetical protein
LEARKKKNKYTNVEKFEPRGVQYAGAFVHKNTTTERRDASGMHICVRRSVGKDKVVLQSQELRINPKHFFFFSNHHPWASLARRGK